MIEITLPTVEKTEIPLTVDKYYIAQSKLDDSERGRELLYTYATSDEKGNFKIEVILICTETNTFITQNVNEYENFKLADSTIDYKMPRNYISCNRSFFGEEDGLNLNKFSENLLEKVSGMYMIVNKSRKNKDIILVNENEDSVVVLSREQNDLFILSKNYIKKYYDLYLLKTTDYSFLNGGVDLEIDIKVELI